MSLSMIMSAQKIVKFIIPYLGKMYRSNISRGNQALCFLINKGYFETPYLDSLLAIKEGVKPTTLSYVASIDKIRCKDGTFVYRQCVVFTNLTQMLNLCRLQGICVMFGQDFHVTVDCLMNCVSDLPYMKCYASRFNEPIDVWLTNCCIIHMHELLKLKAMYTEYEAKVNQILYRRKGYFDRAPFLLANYDRGNSTSAIFLEMDTNDSRLYSMKIADKKRLDYGYTSENINLDRKKGVF